jgi:hypothetical protein
MRRDLGLALDQQWYKREMKKRLDDVLAEMDGWIERLDAREEIKDWIRQGAHGTAPS